MLEAGKLPTVAIVLRAVVTDMQQVLGLLGWCRGLNSGPGDFAASHFNHCAVCLVPFFFFSPIHLYTDFWKP